MGLWSFGTTATEGKTWVFCSTEEECQQLDCLPSLRRMCRFPEKVPTKKKFRPERAKMNRAAIK
jgi:hypothetical protein